MSGAQAIGWAMPGAAQGVAFDGNDQNSPEFLSLDQQGAPGEARGMDNQ